jgi:DNA-binding FrmR family transcriptional regulator
MAHTVNNRKKLLTRVRRIGGQVGAIERTLEGEHDCFELLQQIASVRGAINGLMAEIIEGHVYEHIAGAAGENERNKGAEELMDILRSYLK